MPPTAAAAKAAPSPAADPFLRLFAVWEEGATQAADHLLRDPRTLAFGAAMMSSQLHAARAVQSFWRAMWLPFAPTDQP